MAKAKMGIKTYIYESLGRKFFPKTMEYMKSQVNKESARADYMEESLTTIQLELENLTYQRLNQTSFLNDYRYTRKHLINIIELSVHMALKNPITARTVNVQADYVFARGVSFVAKHPWIQQVIDEFVNYRENKKSLFSNSAMRRQEKRQQVYGSMFFALFTNQKTGRVIVRNLNALEVGNIILDPDDAERELYIKHITVDENLAQKVVYHPSYGVDQYSGFKLPWLVNPKEECEEGDILWNAPVLHIADNRLGREKFAMPEVYPQGDWSIALKRFYEDWTSIIRAFARMAMKVTGMAGKKQAGAAKSLMNTAVSLNNPLERNPSPVGGSMPILGKGVDIEAVKTSGATTPASEGDALVAHAACAVGLPKAFFTGDSQASKSTLDRPTELKMQARQNLWIEIFTFILDYVIQQAAIAPEGILTGYGAQCMDTLDVFDGRAVQTIIWPLNKDVQVGPVGEPINPSYEVSFPELLEADVADRVRSLVNAVTLFGKPLTDMFPDKRLVAKLLLQALNIPNAEGYLPSFVEMWTENQNVEPGEKATKPWIVPPPAPVGGGQGAEDPAQGGQVGKNG